jgi:transposase
LKFIAKLTLEEEVTLTEAYHNHPLFRVRQRAHAILLNNRRYVVAGLSELFEAQHEAVSSWLDKWEKEGLMGIYDDTRSGRPSLLTGTEQAIFLGYIDENPHQPKAAAARLLKDTGKVACLEAFKRVLKKAHTHGSVAGNR